MLFLSIEEARLTAILKSLQTTRHLPSPMQMSSVDTHWKQSQRDSYLSARSAYIVQQGHPTSSSVNDRRRESCT
eukprot:4772985-Amphidinium_carterae.1